MSHRNVILRRATPAAIAAFGLALLGGIFSTPAVAQQSSATAIAAGRTTAMYVCSACHIVGDKQEFEPLLKQPAPSFQQIANNPATTTKSLRSFITATHWDEKTIPMTMPNPALADFQVDAVSSYIMSLRTKS
jgi:mono/diheme cytochrome c family protein